MKSAFGILHVEVQKQWTFFEFFLPIMQQKLNDKTNFNKSDLKS